jgi:hypothetical protein
MNAEQKECAKALIAGVKLSRHSEVSSAKAIALLQELVDAKEPEPVGEAVDFNGFNAALCDRFQARDVGMQPAECAAAIRAMNEKGTA